MPKTINQFIIWAIGIFGNASTAVYGFNLTGISLVLEAACFGIMWSLVCGQEIEKSVKKA